MSEYLSLQLLLVVHESISTRRENYIKESYKYPRAAKTGYRALEYSDRTMAGNHLEERHRIRKIKRTGLSGWGVRFRITRCNVGVVHLDWGRDMLVRIIEIVRLYGCEREGFGSIIVLRYAMAEELGGACRCGVFWTDGWLVNVAGLVIE